MQPDKNSKFRIEKYWGAGKWLYMPEFSVEIAGLFRTKTRWVPIYNDSGGFLSEEDARKKIDQIKTNIKNSSKTEYIYID